MRRRGTGNIRTRAGPASRRAVEALLEPGPGRAETIQRIFSLEYDPGWRKTDECDPREFPRFLAASPWWSSRKRLQERVQSPCNTSIRIFTWFLA